MTFDLAVSLGPTCRTKLQLRRIFGSNNCVYGVFDAQVTPYSALCAYFRNDFRGHFELHDVVPVASRWRVWNFRYGTFHPHLTPHGIAVDFDKARERHEWLCDNIRSALRGSGRILFVRERVGNMPDVPDLKALISESHPKLQFEIATVRDDSEYSAGWQGNAAAWDSALAGYRISAPAAIMNAGGRLARHFQRLCF